MTERTASEIMRGAFGDRRTDDQCIRDGARVTMRQIDDLRVRLDRAYRNAAYVEKTGQERKSDAATWRAVAKAANRLLDGFAV